MKNKKAAVIIAVIVIIASLVSLKVNFPDLTFPVIGSYFNEPDAPSSKGSPYKHYYAELAPIEKQAYNMIMEKIYDMPEKILVPNLNEEELDNVFRALLYDNPDLFFLGRKCSIKPELWNDFFTVEYIISKEEYEAQRAKLKLACDMIIAGLTQPDNAWQTELEIHNKIVDGTSYKIEDREYVYSSAYGCLVNGVAACEGYSKAAKLLFDRVGIESAVISGTASTSQEKGGAHMWNVVKIEDEWYHLDCTWDDPVTDKKKPLRLYTYFNVSDEVIGKTHFDFSIDMKCISDSASYYSKAGISFPDYGKDDESALINKIYEHYRKGEKHIQINFINEESYNAAYSQLIANSRLPVLLSEKRTGSSNLGRKLKGYYEYAELYALTLIFE